MTDVYVVAEPVTCVASSATDDWFLIVRAEHSHTGWMKKTKWGYMYCNSGRISDCCIEGPGYEILALADDMAKGRSDSYTRCEAIRVDGGYELSSPRNSEIPAFVPDEYIQGLIAAIRAAVANPAAHTEKPFTTLEGYVLPTNHREYAKLPSRR